MGNFFRITIEKEWAAKIPFNKQSHKCSLGLKILSENVKFNLCYFLKHAYLDYTFNWNQLGNVTFLSLIIQNRINSDTMERAPEWELGILSRYYNLCDLCQDPKPVWAPLSHLWKRRHCLSQWFSTSNLVISWIIPPTPNSYIKVLTHITLECDLIWK